VLLLLLPLHVQGVNTTWFDPAAYTPLSLSDKAQLVFGKPWSEKQQQLTNASSSTAPHNATKSSGGDSIGQQRKIASSRAADSSSGSSSSTGSSSSSSSSNASQPRKPFVFISAFKWELRKGWDVLLQAYLSEFTAEDDVELYILTQPFGDSGSGFKEKMHSWADKMRKEQSGSEDNKDSRPSTADSSMALVQAAASGNFPALVPASAAAASPALVLPGTQGEGDKLGPARCLQELLTQQQQEQEQEQEHSKDASNGDEPAQLPDNARSADSTSVGVDVHKQSKAHAQLITQQIRQFAWSNITAPAMQQQRRKLLQDSQQAAASEVRLAAAGPQLGVVQRRLQQQAEQLQDADPAAEAAAAAARYPTLYVVDSHISGATADMT
jgi:hypothetical protein